MGASELCREGDAAVGRFILGLEDYAVVLLDTDGIVLSWNAGAQALNGYHANDILGEHFSLFYTRQARAAGHPQRELAVAAAIGRYEEQGWRVHKDGRQFWAHIIIKPIFTECGILRGFGKIVRDCTEQKQSAEQAANVMNLLELTARTDFLTGLENRRSFDAEFIERLAWARRYDRKLCLALLDLDAFKQFNDTHGHPAGDTYLRRAGAVWREAVRATDFVARYGGEEFAVLLPDTAAAEAMDVIGRLRALTPPPLTCSAGLAEWDGKEPGQNIINRADRALYDAKRAGGNTLILSGMTRPAERIQLAPAF